MNTGGLIAPADVQTIDEGAIARSVHGAQSSAPTWAVGDPVATALSGLSDMVDKYAKAYDDVVVNDYTMQKSKELDDLYNNPDTGIFNTRKGDKAQGAYQDYKATIRDMWDHDAMDKLTERQRDMASKPLYALFSDYGHRVAAFETKQLMGAQEERCKNTVQTAQDLLATGRATDNDIANGINAIRIAYEKMGEMQGWDGETIARMQNESISSAFTKASAALSITDPIAAQGLLKANQALMTPAAYAAAMQALDAPVREAKENAFFQLLEQGETEKAQALLQENTAGGIITTRGKRGSIADDQNNPWNLSKRGSVEGVTPQRQRFERFNSPEEGTVAAYRQFVRYNHGQTHGKYIDDPYDPNRKNPRKIPMNTVRGMVYLWQSGKKDNPRKTVADMANAGLPVDKPFDAASPEGKHIVANMMAHLAQNESSWKIAPQQILQVINGGKGGKRPEMFVAYENPKGMLEKGNIDIANRPRTKNADGSYSTVRSMSFEFDGKQVVVPTISEAGQPMTPDEAIEQFRKTGKHLGIFDTVAHAEEYAQKLHEQQEEMYAGDAPNVDYARPAPGMFSIRQAENLRDRGRFLMDKMRVRDAYEVLQGMNRHDAKEMLSTPEGQQRLGLTPELAASLWHKLSPMWKAVAAQEVHRGVDKIIDSVSEESLDKRDAKAMELLNTQFEDDEDRAAAAKEYAKRMKDYDARKYSEAVQSTVPVIQKYLDQGMTKRELYDFILDPNSLCPFTDYQKIVAGNLLAKEPKESLETYDALGRLMAGVNRQLQEGKKESDILQWASDHAFGNLTNKQTKKLLQYVKGGGNISNVSYGRCDRIYREMLNSQDESTKGKHLSRVGFALMQDNLDENVEKYSDEQLMQLMARLIFEKRREIGRWFDSESTVLESVEADNQDRLGVDDPALIEQYQTRMKEQTGKEVTKDDAAKKAFARESGIRVNGRHVREVKNAGR